MNARGGYNGTQRKEAAIEVGIDPKVEYAFKRLFGVAQNRHRLVDLIDAVLASNRLNKVWETDRESEVVADVTDEE